MENRSKLEQLMAQLRMANAGLTEALARRARLESALADERMVVEKIRGDVSSIEDEIMADVRRQTGGDK